jgi:hypothetical protein
MLGLVEGGWVNPATSCEVVAPWGAFSPGRKNAGSSEALSLVQFKAPCLENTGTRFCFCNNHEGTRIDTNAWRWVTAARCESLR